MMHNMIPILILTAAALLCFTTIWTARQERRLEHYDYSLLVKTGLLAYLIMVFILNQSTVHIVLLLLFTIAAFVCYTISFVFFSLGIMRLSSKRFRILTIGGMLAYIGTIPLMPHVWNWLN